MATPKQIAALEARADAGDAESQYDIAQRSLAGDGVSRDAGRARALMQSAARQNHADAIYMLGIWAQTGEFEPEDPVSAASHYERAGDLGHARAMLNLGILYQAGVGKPVDIEAARKMYVRATEAGSGHAADNLGKLYQSGALTGGEADYSTAIQWYRKAVKLGYADARTALEGAQAAMGIPMLMTGEVRSKSSSLWKRLLGLR